MTSEAQRTEPKARTTGAPSNARVPVLEVPLPADARTLTTLSRVDYTDAFRLDTDHALDRTGEEWTRAILQEAPPATRRALRRGWFLLGVRLGPAEDERLVLGWEVRRSSPEFAVLAASSLIGLDAEVLCQRHQRGLLVATFVHLSNPVARVVWAAISPHHRKVLRHLIGTAGSRVHNDVSARNVRRTDPVQPGAARA